MVFGQQTPGPAPSPGGKKSASEVVKKSSNGPPLAEILDWLKDKVDSEANIDMSHTDTSIGYAAYEKIGFKMEEIDRCHFILVQYQNRFEVIVRGTPYLKPGEMGVGITVTKTPINLANLRSDVKVRPQEWPSVGKTVYLTKQFVAVSMYVVNPSEPLVSTSTESNAVTSEDNTDIWFPASSLDVATRVGKALGDAIVKCGGKRVKEIY
jgi:hypothetical protein